MEMCVLLWKIITWCHCYHITLKARHIPGYLNVMADLLSRLNQVQSTEWSLHPQVFRQICQKWFTPHVDLFATLLYASPIPDPNDWDIDALNINWTSLTAYAYPVTAFLHRAIQKIALPDHCNSPRLARNALVLGPSATVIPLQLPVSTTLLKQYHNHVFHSNLQHLNLHTWCLGVDSSKNNASLWRWQQGPSTSQGGPYLRNGAVSPLDL